MIFFIPVELQSTEYGPCPLPEIIVPPSKFHVYAAPAFADPVNVTVVPEETQMESETVNNEVGVGFTMTVTGVRWDVHAVKLF